MKRILFITYWPFENEASNGICKKIRAQAEAEGIALPWEDSAVVYTTGAAAPDPTAGGGESSGNSSSSPGSGDPGTYHILSQPIEAGN